MLVQNYPRLTRGQSGKFTADRSADRQVRVFMLNAKAQTREDAKQKQTFAIGLQVFLAPWCLRVLALNHPFQMMNTRTRRSALLAQESFQHPPVRAGEGKLPRPLYTDPLARARAQRPSVHPATKGFERDAETGDGMLHCDQRRE